MVRLLIREILYYSFLYKEKGVHEGTEDEIDGEVARLVESLTLVCHSHDSGWKMGVIKPGENHATPLSSFGESRDNMEHLFKLEDFAKPIRGSDKFPGEKVFEFFGKEIEYGDYSQEFRGQVITITLSSSPKPKHAKITYVT